MNFERHIKSVINCFCTPLVFMMWGFAIIACACSDNTMQTEPEVAATGFSMIVRSRAQEGVNKGESLINPAEITAAIYDATTGKQIDKASSASGGKLQVFPIVSDGSAFRIFYDTGDMGLNDSHDYITAIAVNVPDTIDAGITDTGFKFDIDVLNATDGYKGMEIPMFGFKRWNPKTIGKYAEWNSQPSLGTIWLLRSVCKVEVTLGDTERARMLSFPDDEPPVFPYGSSLLNRTASIAPDASAWFDSPAKPAETDEMDEDAAFNECPSRPFVSSRDVVMSTFSDDRRSCYIYLPEASASTLEDDVVMPLRLNITAQYTDTNGTHRVRGTLFPSLPHSGGEDSKPLTGTDYNSWKLKRNHVYSFTITDFTDENGFSYKVADSEPVIINVPDYE